ncbi:hypothetical protein QYE76_013536 [Lolium multiflorum]|uniref:Cytochrome P450 n=1 Tax=Lolium multiflorum TaxID=4521 RepID=A0AAD8U461_LOLMU|nr:hypothetical protein QYE76_013536 [Lolium multiflorum]
MEITHIAVLFFLFTTVLLYARRRRASPSAYCPHPHTVLGNTVEFIRNRGRFFDWYTDMLRAAPSNTIEAWGPFGASHAVTTADPAAVDHLLRAKFANYNRGAQFRAAQSDLIGDGIFGADGRLWSLQRKLASYAFSSRSLRRFTQDVLAVHLGRRLLPFLEAAALSGEAVDLQETLRRFAFDNICHVAFGVESSTFLEWGDPQHQALFKAFDTAVEISFMRTLTPSTPVRKLTKLLNVGKSRRLREAIGVIDNHAMSVIEAKEATQRNNNQAEGDPDLLSRMEKLWSENFLEFLPERWLSDDGEFVAVDAAQYPVFHAGPRACPGKEMAYLQMKTVAAAVLRRFTLNVQAPTASMESPPAYEMTGGMKILGGLHVQLKIRD